MRIERATINIHFNIKIKFILLNYNYLVQRYFKFKNLIGIAKKLLQICSQSHNYVMNDVLREFGRTIESILELRHNERGEEKWRNSSKKCLESKTTLEGC